MFVKTFPKTSECLISLFNFWHEGDGGRGCKSYESESENAPLLLNTKHASNILSLFPTSKNTQNHFWYFHFCFRLFVYF